MRIIYGVKGINRIDRKTRSKYMIVRVIGWVQFDIASIIAKKIKGANLDSEEGIDRAWFYSVGQL